MRESVHQSFFLILALAALVASPATMADQATLTPVADTMLLSGDDELRSNGSGRHFCVGMTGQPGIRRSLVKFDLVASPIPVGSTIDSVTLDLYVNKAAPNGGGAFALHRVLTIWGEGASDAQGGECKGADAELNDATWLYNDYDMSQWGSPGGDFDGSASASLTLDGSNGHKSWSSTTMADDVEGWLNAPATNFGWLIKRTSETGTGNALRFSSRQSNQSSQWPRLIVDYTPPAGSGACCFPGQVCEELTAAECSSQGGNFQEGDCSPNPCPPDPVGACCEDDGTCQEVTELQCQGLNGSYAGDGSLCASVECPIILEPFVDPLPYPAVAQPTSGTPGGTASYEIAMREVQQQLHRDLPPTTVWGYGDGPSGATYPGPTIEARTNHPVTVAWINDIRDTSQGGQPLRTDHYLTVPGLEAEPGCQVHGAEDSAKAVVHLHGGHVEAASDGYPESTVLPGEQAAYDYPNIQPAATLWYHDHSLGTTRLNVYMGLAGFYLVRDDFEDGLGLPSCPNPADPNTCFEWPIVIQDRSFHPDGSLKYPETFQDQFFGDKILVNGKVWPYLEVNQGKYRFRIISGSTSRTYRLTLDRLDLPGGADVPFVQIGTDGGLLELPVPLDEITLGPGERADLIVDFETIPVGTEIILTNDAPAPFPAGGGGEVIPDVMKFVVLDQAGHTADLPGTLRPYEVLDETSAVKVRDFVLDKEPDACGTIWKINGLGWDDITEYPTLGTTEIWRFSNPVNVMHPMHMHLVFFQVLDRTPIDGGEPIPPDPNELGWKDTVRADPNMITRVIARFEDYVGLYAYHCHILEHEDHEMMRQFRTVEAPTLTVEPGQLTWSPQPGAESYDIVRGDLHELVATQGNFAFASVTELCVANDQVGVSIPNADTPATGAGYWYLLRAVDEGGNGTYDTGSSAQEDRRDDEIDASGNDCP